MKKIRRIYVAYLFFCLSLARKTSKDESRIFANTYSIGAILIVIFAFPFINYFSFLFGIAFLAFSKKEIEKFKNKL